MVTTLAAAGFDWVRARRHFRRVAINRILSAAEVNRLRVGAFGGNPATAGRFNQAVSPARLWLPTDGSSVKELQRRSADVQAGSW